MSKTKRIVLSLLLVLAITTLALVVVSPDRWGDRFRTAQRIPTVVVETSENGDGQVPRPHHDSLAREREQRVGDELTRLGVSREEQGNLAVVLNRRAGLWTGGTAADYDKALADEGLPDAPRWGAGPFADAWERDVANLRAATIHWDRMRLLTPSEAAGGLLTQGFGEGYSSLSSDMTVSRGTGDVIGKAGNVRRALVASVPATFRPGGKPPFDGELRLTFGQRRDDDGWVATSLGLMGIPPGVQLDGTLPPP